MTKGESFWDSPLSYFIIAPQPSNLLPCLEVIPSHFQGATFTELMSFNSISVSFALGAVFLKTVTFLHVWQYACCFKILAVVISFSPLRFRFLVSADSQSFGAGTTSPIISAVDLASIHVERLPVCFLLCVLVG